MCIQNTLQQHILDITNDGKDIANFFYATMHGQNPNAKFHHQMDAAKHLSKLGLPTLPSLSQPQKTTMGAKTASTPLPPRRGKAGMGVKIARTQTPQKPKKTILPILYILLVPLLLRI